jgi:hypothetical protein
MPFGALLGGMKRVKNKPTNSTVAAGQQGGDCQLTAAQMMGRSCVSNAAARGSIV